MSLDELDSKLLRFDLAKLSDPLEVHPFDRRLRLLGTVES